MELTVPVFMPGPQGGRVVQLPIQSGNAAGLQQHSGDCYTLVPVQAEQHHYLHQDMVQQQHLQQMQIPPPRPASPPGWLGQLEQEASMPHGTPVCGHRQQRQMQIPHTPSLSANGLATGVRQGSERGWVNDKEALHGWLYEGRLPERSWADMSEQGQSHGPMMKNRLPMRGQFLASSPMVTKRATECGQTLRDPTLLPASAQTRRPRKQRGNTMFGGTRADRQQGIVDCSLNQKSPSAEPDEYGLRTNMKAQLQALLNEDPSTVFIVRRINKLGFSSAEYLRTHFRFYGEVKSVYVSHSRVKIKLPNDFRGERRSTDTRERMRPASLAFVVMASADATARILADGPEHTIHGVTVLLGVFHRRERVEGAAGQTDENNEATEAGATGIDAVDYPHWPSAYNEAEGDDDQPPQTLLDGGTVLDLSPQTMRL